MRILTRQLGIVCLVGALHAPGAWAQQQLLPQLQTASDVVEPGTWVRYTLFNRKTYEVSSVRIVALEREDKGQWMEIDLTDQRRNTTVFKALVEGSLAQPKKVLRTVVQPPGHQPIELPPKQAKVQLPKLGPKLDSKARIVSRGKVKVAAGTFTATRYRSKDQSGRVTEIWSSDDVQGWPMIKAATPHALLELTGHGTGGRSKIRGKPAQLDPDLLKKLDLTR